VKVSVVGAGSFGSAVADLGTRCNHDVLLWAHDPKVAEAIETTRSNPFYLPSLRFSDRLSVTASLSDIASFSDLVVMAVPSHHYRTVLSQLAEHIHYPIRVVSATKGIENQTLKRMSQVTAESLPDRLECFGAFSGPTFAIELSRGDPTAAVIASRDAHFAEEMQARLSSDTFRLYRSDDVIGVELAGSLKNVIAIAAGVLEGIGLGFNTNAALITRGLHEIRRLGMALGGRPETFAGLAGMGDLVLTCTGSISRNRAVGVELGKGKKLETILTETRLIAEGVKTCKSAHDLAQRHQIEMPIIREMHSLLYEGATAKESIQRLMTRTLKPE